MRPLAPGDSFAELTDLLHAAYAPLAEQGLHYLASRQDVAETKRRAMNGHCFVAVTEDQTLAGTITLYRPIRRSRCFLYEEQDVWHFGQFGVLPTYQNLGLGQRLLETVEQEAKDAGAFRLACDTATEALKLIDLYERKGYVQSGTFRWEGVTNYESVILVKSLTNAKEVNS